MATASSSDDFSFEGTSEETTKEDGTCDVHIANSQGRGMNGQSPAPRLSPQADYINSKSFFCLAPSKGGAPRADPLMEKFGPQQCLMWRSV